MPVWNPIAIDYSKGVKKVGNRTVGNVIGCYVMTTEEAEECLRNREDLKHINFDKVYEHE